ncbi:MAG: TrkA family potassium uptake protein [Clostridia bacterium]|nr:TrkA family potassium uptake protein [Clostridia bacterium]
MINKTYAVFGLGKYGRAVASELSRSGADVIAVDMDEAIVEDAIEEIPICKCANVTDPEVIKQLGIADVDVVIIAMATRFESSVMATMLCKDIGVKRIIIKCNNEFHGRVLKKIGADQIIYPELESGTRLAKNLLSSGFVDMFELSDDISIVELDVKPEWVGKSLIELDLRRRYSLNILAIKKNEAVSTIVDPMLPLTEDMELIVMANVSKIEKLK